MLHDFGHLIAPTSFKDLEELFSQVEKRNFTSLEDFNYFSVSKSFRELTCEVGVSKNSEI